MACSGVIPIKAISVFICGIFFLTSCGVDISGRPPFEDLTFSSDFSHISTLDGKTWNVAFELPVDSTFTGVARHTSLWYDSSAPFMSHDILVTTGDFASQDFVDVNVVAHKFFYHWDDARPTGTINLLHIFPATAEIFDQLKEIKKWNNVTISGREILKIDKYDADGTYLGYMTDAGCNTILVTSVTINAVGTPIP
jgi:hypothetical protein